MINIGRDTIYKRIGQNYQTILTEPARFPDRRVSEVIKPLTDNKAGKFTQQRNKATELAEKLHISYDEALKKLYSQGEHAIDFFA